MDKIRPYLPYIQLFAEALAAAVAGYTAGGKQGAGLAVLSLLYGKFTKRPQDK